MDRNNTIELLKQALSEVPRLRTLDHHNRDFTLWLNRVRDILEVAFGKNSTEYARFSKAVTTFWGRSDTEKQEAYDSYLNDYETVLESIIRKYETLGIEEKPAASTEPPKVFISHGKGGGALLKLESFLNGLGVQPIIVKNQPNLDRTINEKVEGYLNEADFVIIFATGDDKVADAKKGEIKQPRQNVIHEIGLAQKTQPGKIIYLLEEGAKFPSNITPKVYQSFVRQSMDGAFTSIVREMRKLGILKAVKPPKETSF